MLPQTPVLGRSGEAAGESREIQGAQRAEAGEGHFKAPLAVGRAGDSE